MERALLKRSPELKREIAAAVGHNCPQTHAENMRLRPRWQSNRDSNERYGQLIVRLDALRWLEDRFLSSDYLPPSLAVNNSANSVPGPAPPRRRCSRLERQKRGEHLQSRVWASVRARITPNILSHYINTLFYFLAERVGFEPTVRTSLQERLSA
jgi:hypothetical protein